MQRTLCLLILATQVLSAGQASRHVFLGVLRTDGLLIPTAVFNGTEWWNAWPFSNEDDETVTTLPLPTSIERMPSDWLPPGTTLPRRWRLQKADGSSVAIRLSGFARTSEFTLASWIGVATDYAGQRSQPGTSDEEVGVAASGAADLGTFQEVPVAVGSRLVAALAPQFNAAENEAISERIKWDYQGRTYTFPVDQQLRAKQPVTINRTLVAKKLHSGNTVYYLTGAKAYGAESSPKCDVLVQFSAVLIRDAGGRVSAPRVDAYTAFDCSGAYILGFEPLASVHWAGKPLWLIRINDEDGFSYSLTDPLRRKGTEDLQLKGEWSLRDHIAPRQKGR